MKILVIRTSLLWVPLGADFFLLCNFESLLLLFNTCGDLANVTSWESVIYYLFYLLSTMSLHCASQMKC